MVPNHSQMQQMNAFAGTGAGLAAMQLSRGMFKVLMNVDRDCFGVACLTMNAVVLFWPEGMDHPSLCRVVDVDLETENVFLADGNVVPVDLLCEEEINDVLWAGKAWADVTLRDAIYTNIMRGVPLIMIHEVCYRIRLKAFLSGGCKVRLQETPVCRFLKPKNHPLYYPQNLGDAVLFSLVSALPNDSLATILCLNHNPMDEIRVFSEQVVMLRKTKKKLPRREPSRDDHQHVSCDDSMKCHSRVPPTQRKKTHRRGGPQGGNK